MSRMIKPTNSPRRVVIPLLAGVGNSIMAGPMVRQLKAAWPEARITILARNQSIGEPMRRLAEVEEVLITGAGMGGLMKCLNWTWTRKPDLYLVPFPSNRWQYGLLVLSSFARRKILHSYPIGYFRALGFAGTRMPAERGIHDVIQNLQLLRLLDIEAKPEAPAFSLTQAERSKADEILQNAGIKADAKLIAIHAGSATTVLASAKRWPVQKYAKLIGRLRSDFPHEIVLIEGPDEVGVAQEIIDQGAEARVVKLIGPLGEAAAVLARASLYVGSDSGLAHLAAAVGTKPVTIFGPADPDRVSPYGYRDLVVQSPRNCGPCFLYPWQSVRPKVRCRNPMCITFIEPEMVMEKIQKAIDRK